jgi:replicative DNA helicase
MSANFITATAVAESSAFDPDAPAPPRYDPGPTFAGLDVRPGRVVLIGAPPAAGKTAVVLQVTVDVLRNHPDVRALVANVEMHPADLLARIVARLGEIPVGKIMDKTLTPTEKNRHKATRLLRPPGPRPALLRVRPA